MQRSSLGCCIPRRVLLGCGIDSRFNSLSTTPLIVKPKAASWNDWDAEVKDHEAPGGKYANGVIVRQYKPGEIIRITSHITANHAGFVDFKLCRNNNINQDPTQDCFDLPEASLAVVEAGHVR